MAALIGVEADVSVSVDTKKIVEDAKTVADVAVKAPDTIVKTSEKVVDVAKDIGHNAESGVNKAGKKAKKAFHL